MTNRSLSDTIEDLERQGVVFFLEQDRVRFTGPPALTASAAFQSLSSRRNEVLELLKRRGGHTRLPIVTRRVQGESSIASVNQHECLLEAPDPFSPVRDRFVARYAISGAIDAAVLDEALRRIIARHEILGARFWWEGTVLRQSRGSAPREVLQSHDISSATPDDQTAFLSRLLADLKSFAFDLSSMPPIFPHLVRLGPRSHVFVILLHHIAADLRSWDIFFAELMAHYDAVQSEGSANLGALPFQYQDFAAWERENLSCADAFWESRMNEADPLEVRRSRGAPGLHKMKKAPIIFGEGCQDWIGRFAVSQKVTPPIVLASMFNYLLGVWCGARRPISSIVCSGRVAGSEQIIGSFAQVRPFIVPIEEGATIVDLVRAGRQPFIDANDIRNHASHRLLRARDLGRVRINIVQAGRFLGTAHPTAIPAVDEDELQVRNLSIQIPGNDIEPNHLLVRVALGASGYESSASFASDVVEEKQVRWFCDQMPGLLRKAIDSPGAPLSSLVARP